jgi:hypothetical protein
MNSAVQNGYLLLADISGFTGFMAATELDHSREILSDLINNVIESLSPLFVIAEVEGDAVFAYSSENKFSRGETLLELIELTYFNFSFRKIIMHEKTSCTCKGCQSISSLDLKFIVHYGNFVLQDYAGRLKPLGSDVNLAHRFLKNKVSEKTKLKAYSLISGSCIEKLDMLSEIFIPHEESYEHFGSVATYIMDLTDAFKKISETKRYFLTEQDSDFIAEHEFKFQPMVLWEWFIDFNKRMKWMEGTVWLKGDRKNGRMEAGATNHCCHGKERHLEVILDWKPFDYYTYESGNKLIKFVSTLRFIENENGTKFQEMIKLKNKLPKFISKPLTRMIALKVMKVYDAYKKIEELASNSEQIASQQ